MALCSHARKVWRPHSELDVGLETCVQSVLAQEWVVCSHGIATLGGGAKCPTHAPHWHTLPLGLWCLRPCCYQSIFYAKIGESDYSRATFT